VFPLKAIRLLHVGLRVEVGSCLVFDRHSSEASLQRSFVCVVCMYAAAS